jgi:glycolate oxidase
LLLRIAELSQSQGLRCINVFHAGDGNLHPLILYDGAQPEQWQRAERLGADIVEACVALGGTISGEHGVGLEKLSSMCVQFSVQERAAFFAVRAAFDPAGLLNPGKALPTPRRCIEYGRQHVGSAGPLRHPDLPRF